MLALHLANQTDTDAARVAPLCDDFIVLSIFPQQMPAIRASNPNARFHVRWWLDKGALPDSLQEARKAAAWWATWGAYVASSRCGNEGNLETPHTAQQYMAWQMNFAFELHRLIPGISLWLPAPSPGMADSPDWVQGMADCARENPDLFIGLDAHAYGTPQEVDGVLSVFRHHWQGPLNVTECNFGAGRQWDLNAYAAALPEYLAVARKHKVNFLGFFIWVWNNPDMKLPTTASIKDTPMETAMRNYVDGGETVAWDRHAVYDEWQKLFGGQGYNPGDAFGQIIKSNPDREYGVFVGGYHVEEPFIYAYTTVGIFCYDKRSSKAVFATSEEELPFS
ncbi:MAG: hypothetical protein M1343_08390 [Chloroflexi bacterium]|nr:hypothetical protein [Chloroflexota bacterium]